MTNSGRSQQFGKRREPVQIVIAKGSNVRSFFLRPWLTTSLTLFAVVFSVTYLAATSYLIFRDDLITFSDHRTDRMRHDYEDRIAYLRSQIDKMTSRSLVDQETLETKLEIMLQRQEELSSRHEIITSVLNLARRTGIKVPATLQQPVAKPAGGNLGAATFLLRSGSPTPDLSPGKGERPRASLDLPGIDLATTNASVNQMAIEASIALDAVRVVADARVREITQALRGAGLTVKTAEPAENGLGGPFIPVTEDEAEEFSLRAYETKRALENFRHLTDAIHDFPIGKPVDGAAESSSYGRRIDPFFNRLAMHSGVDYKAPRGHPIKATGNGVVLSAGRHGGYGRMIDIDHGNGLSTRYAHLSRIRVHKGQKVTKGMVIGNVGSTGRSTGPHLHYEIRVGEHASNPMPFIIAGKKIKTVLRK